MITEEGTRNARSGIGNPVTAETRLPVLEDPTKVAARDARELSRVFLGRLGALEEGTPEFQYIRNTLIELNLSLVRFVATRFRSRGDEMEDIVQVGTVGLIKAIDRFDLTREVEFTTFAIPCIAGEIKRYFRDTGWAVHVPRRLQELRITLAKAVDELAQVLDTDPTPAELAAYLGLSEQEVRQGIVASNGYTASSLDVPLDRDDEAGGSYAEHHGGTDPALDGVEDMAALKPLIARLGERDRLLLRMRFREEMTQSQIGLALGLSQMHVSRLLSHILTRLRGHLLLDA
ncbi:SigB/SigF/SigG family RNA polymerase sigma factor [Streptomyces sp. NPDC002574]|uniref:SigB/SigF/SigG family RNA polymerase sigma factor n=1 Tax=Streptomyces sp. NPDC002574 TaxID=3364652 RepID=UPI0036C29596